jgi:heme/copper-type cytochrome/quinol oxidase subunit 2
MNEAPTQETPRNRFWFVVLAWVTLVLFAAFVALIMISVVSVPKFRKARQTGALPAAWEARR